MSTRGTTGSRLRRDDIDRRRIADRTDPDDPLQPPRADHEVARRAGSDQEAGKEPGRQHGTRVLTAWVIVFLLLTGILSFIALYWPVR